MIDCSHANSDKNPQRQLAVLDDVIAQRRTGGTDIAGVMLESHLHGGSQSLDRPLQYGVSITDVCRGWSDTARALRRLADG